MSAANLTQPMRTVLRSLSEHKDEGLAEVALEFESAFFGGVKNEGGSFHLADKALDKVLAALQRRGLIVDAGAAWELTDAGRAVLAAETAARSAP